MLRLRVVMLLWLLFLSFVFGAPTDEFEDLTSNAEGDILPSEDKLLMNLLPPYAPKSEEIFENRKTYVPTLTGIVKVNLHVENLNMWIDKGITLKGLTFNVYNDEMRQAAVSLFRLFQSVEQENFNILRKWAENNINTEMYIYALRLASLYGSNVPENHILPPFIMNPRYFVNSEAISKAYSILDARRERDSEYLEVPAIDTNDYSFTSYYLPGQIKEFITVNSNYSEWNLPKIGIEKEINYFREDVGLNSYYLGLHLLHPFWMSNEELDQNLPRHAEHYYYAHQQLMARYKLEKEHLPNKALDANQYESDYGPYLTYRNGLAFPTRSGILGDWDNEKALIKSIDLAIKECIDRGLIIMEDGTTVNMTDDSHIEELSRLIRANLDGVRTAKVVRSVFGYGINRFPIDKYNPAPSLLHHPETSLRDPMYWYLIKYMLNYFSDYKNIMEPYDVSQHETKEITILDSEDTQNINFTTYFHSYTFTMNYARNIKPKDSETTFISVRQRRLKHDTFKLRLTFQASSKMTSVVRLYLGPQCRSDCWQQYSNFFELDTFTLELEKGQTTKLFSTTLSKRHSVDSTFDTILLKPSVARKTNSYSIFKFPDNLLIPRGTEEGLNLTLFIMITPSDKNVLPTNNNNYNKAIHLCDSKPLGFPFHRPAIGFKESGINYRFYNVTVYHRPEAESLPKAFFSPNLY